jgi:hypothetical protein
MHVYARRPTICWSTVLAQDGCCGWFDVLLFDMHGYRDGASFVTPFAVLGSTNRTVHRLLHAAACLSLQYWANLFCGYGVWCGCVLLVSVVRTTCQHNSI